jgi:hypothetical protein
VQFRSHARLVNAADVTQPLRAETQVVFALQAGTGREDEAGEERADEQHGRAP